MVSVSSNKRELNFRRKIKLENIKKRPTKNCKEIAEQFITEKSLAVKVVKNETCLIA